MKEDQEQINFSEPKIQLILSIKNHDEKITWFLENHRYMDAAISLHYLLNRLDITESEDDKAMREINKKFTLIQASKITVEDVDAAHIELHKFLNRTYYKGFSNNRPPTRSSSIQNIGAKVNEHR